MRNQKSEKRKLFVKHSPLFRCFSGRDAACSVRICHILVSADPLRAETNIRVVIIISRKDRKERRVWMLPLTVKLSPLLAHPSPLIHSPLTRSSAHPLTAHRSPLNVQPSTTQRSILRVSGLKFTPILYNARVSLAKGRAYPLSLICCSASSAVPFSLNSIT